MSQAPRDSNLLMVRGTDLRAYIPTAVPPSATLTDWKMGDDFAQRMFTEVHTSNLVEQFSRLTKPMNPTDVRADTSFVARNTKVSRDPSSTPTK